eukprot:1808556-Rhodomonas_salina.1
MQRPVGHDSMPSICAHPPPHALCCAVLFASHSPMYGAMRCPVQAYARYVMSGTGIWVCVSSLCDVRYRHRVAACRGEGVAHTASHLLHVKAGPGEMFGERERGGSGKMYATQRIPLQQVRIGLI